MARRWLLLVAYAVGLVHLATAAQVTYLDGASFINVAGTDQLTADGVAGVLGSLLDAETSAHSQAGVSEQVETVLSPSVFQRPSAVLAVQVLGAGDVLSQLSNIKLARSVPVSADASTLLRAVASVVNSNQQSFVYKALDHSGLPSDCGERCKEKKVYDAVMARGFNYTAHEQPSWDCDAGPWCFQIKSGDDRVMNMGFAEDKQFGLELGMLRHKALEAAETHKAGTGNAGLPKLLEATLVGLQAVRSKYGADSKQAAAAGAMLRGTLEEVWAALLESTGGRAVAQLASVDVRLDAKLQDMQQWLTQHRAPFQRRLLQQDGEYRTTDFGDVSVNWARSSSAWLISIILLVFIIASAICLCNMKFEQDTMLYASKKAD